MSKPIIFSQHTINVVSEQMARGASCWVGVFIFKETSTVEVLDLAILTETANHRELPKADVFKEIDVLNLVVKAAEIKAELGFVWGTNKNTLPSGLTEDSDKVVLCITRNEKEFVPWFIRPKGT